MAKKQKKATHKQAPTKHQLSRWQRQAKIRRIVIIAAVVFFVGIGSWVGYESYKDYQSDPSRQVAIEVNGVSFTMGYFVNMFDAYANLYGINSTVISYWSDYLANMVAGNIIDAEVLRQGAETLDIGVTAEEIDAGIEKYGWSDTEAYRDIIKAILLQDKLKNEYFGSGLNNTMEQAHVQIVLVESEDVATELIDEIEAGGNFTALAGEFSCNSSVEGDLGWLPEELMPSTLIADAAFNLTPGDTIHSIYDATAIKDVGYWLIEVTDKQGGNITAMAMLLGSEAEAEQIKAQLAAGGNFGALAEEYSQYAGNTTDGELGSLKPGDMGSDAFDAVAFSLPLNEVSEPVKDESVQTTGGYWLVQVIDRGDHELEETVKNELLDKRFNDWFEERKKDSTVENLLDADKISWAVNKVLEGM